MKKLLLVDGSSLSATCFYGCLPNQYIMAKKETEKQKILEGVSLTKDGIPTKSISLFFTTLGKIIRAGNFTHLAILWDNGAELTFRHELYPEYKGTRSSNELLRKHHQLIKDIAYESNIQSFCVSSYEADDMIGVLNHSIGKNMKTVILTKDQDLLQLIDENTNVWLKTNKAEEMKSERNTNCVYGYYDFNLEEFKHFYKLANPLDLIFYKGLVGDKADNIPGIKGIGDKKAYPLIEKYENMYDVFDLLQLEEEDVKTELKNIYNGSVNGIYKNLKAGIEDGLLSYNLATILQTIHNCNNYQENDFLININGKKFKELSIKYSL